MADAAPLSFRSPGDGLSFLAGDHNAFVDAANYAKAQNLPGALTGPGVDREIWLRNDTGAPIARFAVLQPTGPVIVPTADNRSEYDARLLLIGIKPTTPSAYGMFAIAQAPADVGKIVRCKTFGLTPIKLDVADGTFGRADVADNQSGYLKSHPAGSAQVLWQATSAGTDGRYDALASLNFGGWWPRLLRGVVHPSDASKCYVETLLVNSVFSLWGEDPEPSAVCLVGWFGGPRYVVWECK